MIQNNVLIEKPNQQDWETKEQEAEFYFIQLVFTKNPYLIQRQFRQLYDVLLDKYIPIFLEGKGNRIDVMDINAKYINQITQQK